MTNELEQFENFVETKIVEPVENFFKTNPTAEAVLVDVDTFFADAKALVTRNGGALLLKAAADVLPSLVSMQWGTAVTTLIADAKAAGAETVSEEEQLAASTALQIVQAAGNALTAAGTPTTPTVSPTATPAA